MQCPISTPSVSSFSLPLHYLVGDEKPAIEISSNINVHWVGFTKKEILHYYYRAADCFVFPTREDIWGLVINEAMSYGLPIISSDRCVAALELIENDINGFLFQSESSDELGDDLNKFLSMNRIERDRMGLYSRKRIEEYTFGHMEQIHSSIFCNN